MRIIRIKNLNVQNLVYSVIGLRTNQMIIVRKETFDKMDKILALIGGKPRNVNEIVVVEKIYEYDIRRAVGLWEPKEKRILIMRSQLSTVSAFAGTLLHECAHALSGANDVSRDFELQLSDMLGILAEKCLK